MGIFPSNFVEDVENLYEASFDYHSDVPEDLSFSTGETIIVTSKGMLIFLIYRHNNNMIML